MNKVSELNDLLWFGKYRGQTIEQVLKTDAQYLSWAEDKGIITLSAELQEAVSECAYIQHCEFIRERCDNEQFMET